MKGFLQRLGRSIMLPVSILPAASLLMGIGNWLAAAGANPVASFLIAAGGAVINNLPILFAVGIATGLAKNQNGAAALSGLVGYLVITKLLAPASVAALTGLEEAAVNPAFSKIENAFIGILSGVIAASLYNRFYQQKLPTALAFFSGRRFVPIITAAVMVVVSAVLFVVWPLVYNALVAFGESMIGLGPVGAGIFGFFNRLLIPTGLHHALNSVFWFDVAGINDIGKFWGTSPELAKAAVKGVTGMYQAGFFPIMMFGLPAAAFAIYKNARPEHKKAIASLMIAAAFSAFFTGITEPLEFAFMFAAPALYVVHAALTGVSLLLASLFHWMSGFSFSAGLVDYVLAYRMPMANQPLMLLLLGAGMAVLYYFLFDFMIRRFDIQTPGRGETLAGENAGEVAESSREVTKNSKARSKAQTIFEGLGGHENVENIDYCSTRLRLQVKDAGKIDEAKIRSAGVPGIQKINDKNVQVIVGTDVQFVADEMHKL